MRYVGVSVQDSERVLGRCGETGVLCVPRWMVSVCRALVYTGEVCRQESEHTGVMCEYSGVGCVHEDPSAYHRGSVCSGFRLHTGGGVCTWLRLCFGGGLGKPSAELGSAVPSLVAKLLKSLPFQQQLSRRRSSSDLGGEGGGQNKELSGEGGGRW